PNISRHELTTAMQHLCTSPEGLPYFYDIPVHVKPRKGSSRCVELNHTLRCLCGPPSIPLSFSLAAVLPRRDTYRVSSGAEGGRYPPAPSVHRLGRGLPGYLIRFAPHAFAPQRQGRPSRPPSPLVFLRISTHFTAPPGIPPASAALKTRSIGEPF